MSPQELEAILAGNHSDPFRVLGPHRTDTGWEIRAFLPQAMDAAVIHDGLSYPMRKIRAEGFFVGSLTGEPGHYRLRLTLWSGTQVEIEDPYRFPPMISD